MSRESDVLQKLKRIIDPDLGRDIVSLGFIKKLAVTDAGAVSFAIELTTPACPVKDQFRKSAEDAVRELDWVTDVAVTMTAQPRSAAPQQAQAQGLKGVKHIIAVASCKGGVGKSTVAVNLAVALKRMGAAVGIFDADVYGPSLPTMVAKSDFDGLYQRGGLLLPVETHGLKLMSFAFVNPPDSGGAPPAIMRGAMVHQVILQLLPGTDWGELDYLIIDMPPGTGDIQLTILQQTTVTASVLVTTPQQISFVDVEKGLKMFDKLKVPTVAAVENMATFICDSCEKEHRIFGDGASQKLRDLYGMEAVVSIPIDPAVCAASDSGMPIVMSRPSSPATLKYIELADMVVREVAKVTHGGIKPPIVVYEPGVGIHITPHGTEDTSTLAPRHLRLACGCARCVEEMSGRPILDPDSVPADIEPKNISPMGNYAVAIDWSDGHSSIYPYDALVKLTEKN